MEMGGTDHSTATDSTDNVTARALRAQTLNMISVLLNPLKVLPTDEGIPRDWRGLAQLAGLDGNITMGLGCKTDPTSEVLKMWISKSGVASIGLLKSFLGEMDRWDVVDDTSSMMEQDIKEYSARAKNIDERDRHIAVESDKHILTVDDVCRIEKGLQPQNYDAFLLYAEEDVDFAMEIIEKMEKDYGLKLCIKDRDLVGGLTFEHEAIMKLISERCNRLIVVVSPNFLKSEANKFFVTFAQALGIEQRQRKVVPCLYQRCQLPPELSYYFLLDFNRAGKLWNVWEKLRDSIQAPSLTPDNRRIPESRSWSPLASIPDNLVTLHHQDPPPPYSPSDVTLGAPVSLSVPSNVPGYFSTSNPGEMGWNRISLSASESNLVAQNVSENSLTNNRHGSELDIRQASQTGKDKGKSLRWLRKLLPKEGKKKKHKKKALCN
ncbi:myeloid differentiation primary response protein MyD88 isoform X1 [Ischnura elegans]|uniref:myeloid differentiation primary response protein MyD88 isoform X1 n=1 Tax=Ischnura elegans TaxID=197161 RepID=UPI001ED882D2|nr:myeloid differentiation primary response protein MyD88 isoform X1 [Ischnura elegans]